MADALVSMVLKQLSSIIISEVEQEVRLVVGVKSEVQKLTSNFQAIQAVLTDAEERQLKDAFIKRWLDQLKDVSYDMDDVLDEWSTAIAKSKIEVNEHPRKITWKVCSFRVFSCFRCFHEVALRHDIAHKIKELNERIDGIVNEKDRFHFKSNEVGVKQLEHQMTTSVIDIAEVRGRYEDKKEVVNMLLSTESSEGLSLRVISLVGMGGIGKTTLAKLVYNDDKVETHFEIRIWVCVSDPFDEIRIAKAVLEVLIGSAPNLNELQTLVQHIQQAVRGKKFLLVLDDVWNEDSTKWEQLKNSLKCGSPGSRILVTTRNRNVATSMGSSSTDILEIGQLSEEECWSLFRQVAFFGKTSRECENLEDIGRQIATKCKGLPLAAKSLASLLCFKRSRGEWVSVLTSGVWEIKEAESNLLAPLWLSYSDLPSEMRQCFSFCAVFPKDYIFERNDLIKLWMAQGYLQETPNKEMEVVGQECFQNLAARSFFQDFEKDENDGSVIECKMHDIVHDFAQSLTKNESFSVEINGPTYQSKIESFSKETRHLLIVLPDSDISFPETIHSFKKLRTLFVTGEPSINAAIPKIIDHLSCLRALNLSNCQIKEVPSNIGKLIHMRHLNLSHNPIKELPETLCELNKMLTLDVSYCKYEKLPDNIGKLVKLRHLSVCSHSINWFIMMRGMGGLSCLRELDEFHVSCSSGDGSGEASNLGDLRNLNHLQGTLEIRLLGDVKDPDEAKKVELKSKKCLTSLRLYFHSRRQDRRKIRDEEVLEALEPSPDLESLVIVHYQGITMSPSWIMSLTTLRKVELSSFGKMEHLPPLGKLPSLEELDVLRMDCVKKVGHEFLGLQIDGNSGKGDMTFPSKIITFPKLKSLSFWKLRNWEEWDDDDDGSWRRLGNEEEDQTNMSLSSITPCLRSLSISYCPKLKALPDFLYQSTTLEELYIIDSPVLAKHFRERIGKGWPNISHTPNITIT